MGADAPEVTAEVVRITREWLARIGVLEP